MVRVVVLGRFVDLELLESVAHGRCGRVQGLGNREFGRVVEFRATDPEDLQTVVVVGIVRSGYHDTGSAALTGDDRDARRREVPEVDAVGTAVAKSGQHGAGQVRR